MRRYSLSYFLAEGFKGMWRNGVMSVASIAVLMSCLVVMGGFGLLVATINLNLNNLGDLNQMVVYCEYDATEIEIQELEAQIRLLDNVDSVKRVTKAQALEEMKAASPDEAYLYEDITPENNPLSDSFEISYVNVESEATVEYQLNQLDGVRLISSRAELAKSLDSLKKGVMLIFGWFLLILSVVSLFIIVNTIKLAVYARRHEIVVMRYVGASSWFITLPFAIEGIIIGIVSAIAAFFIEWYGYRYIEKMVMHDLQMISVISFGDVRMLVLVGFLVIGVFAGLVGSWISLTKYAKS